MLYVDNDAWLGVSFCKQWLLVNISFYDTRTELMRPIEDSLNAIVQSSL